MDPFLIAYTIIEVSGMVDHEIVERTWKERLFTLPWRPLLKYKVVTTPSPEIIYDHVNKRIYCHPHTAHQLREYLRSKGVSHV